MKNKSETPENTVYEYIDSGARYFSSYNPDVKPEDVVSVAHTFTIREAQHICGQRAKQNNTSQITHGWMIRAKT